MANITFNPMNNTIEVTKKFLNEARVINSPAYKELAQIKRDFPYAEIALKTIKKKTNKISYKGLSIEEMTRFVSTRSEREQKTFECVIKLAAKKSGKYALIKKWFLDHYKNEYLNELNSLSNIDEDALAAELDALDTNDDTNNEVAAPLSVVA